MKYLIVIHNLNEDSQQSFGPYTEQSAHREMEKIEKFYERQRIAMDEDSLLISVQLQPVDKWKPGEIIRLPKRPLCPHCKKKLGVWEAAWGEQIGVCKNRECDKYQAEWSLKLNSKETRWLIDKNPSRPEDE